MVVVPLAPGFSLTPRNVSVNPGYAVESIRRSRSDYQCVSPPCKLPQRLGESCDSNAFEPPQADCRYMNNDMQVLCAALATVVVDDAGQNLPPGSG